MKTYLCIVYGTSQRDVIVSQRDVIVANSADDARRKFARFWGINNLGRVGVKLIAEHAEPWAAR